MAFYRGHDRDPHRGYGPGIGNVFAGLRELDQKEALNLESFTQPAAAQFNGNGSHGNGGAMRVSPAALYGVETDEVKKMAIEFGI